MLRIVSGFLVGILIGTAAGTVLASVRDITTRKPTGEIILILEADGGDQKSVTCPECGLTYFVNVQINGPLEDLVLVVTYWHDRQKTMMMRRQLSLFNDIWIAERP